MSDSLLILGRQPALGLAELESLFGAADVRPAGAVAALVNRAAADIPFARLGGTVKLAEVLANIPSTEWRDIERMLLQLAPREAAAAPEGKLRLGVSAYGFSVRPAQVEALGLSLKKAVKKAGRSVRLVPNKEAALSSAQTFHNRLAHDTGREYLIVRASDKNTLLARVTAVQDINSYTLRDRGRPKRDARVGMLPPKLAQIIINLAAAQTPPAGNFTILDPFCGTGVVLQEALLMGFDAAGTDLEQRMVDYSIANLEWLKHQFSELPGYGVARGDATGTSWQTSVFYEHSAERALLSIGAVAGETYLGRPFTSAPAPDVLSQTASEVNLILKKFLQNVRGQLAPGARLCIAVPAWQTAPGRFKHLPLIDQISDLGYNRVSFEHARDADLLYYREGQIVARELIVLTKR